MSTFNNLSYLHLNSIMILFYVDGIVGDTGNITWDIGAHGNVPSGVAKRIMLISQYINQLINQQTSFLYN